MARGRSKCCVYKFLWNQPRRTKVYDNQLFSFSMELLKIEEFLKFQQECMRLFHVLRFIQPNKSCTCHLFPEFFYVLLFSFGHIFIVTFLWQTFCVNFKFAKSFKNNFIQIVYNSSKFVRGSFRTTLLHTHMYLATLKCMFLLFDHNLFFVSMQTFFFLICFFSIEIFFAKKKIIKKWKCFNQLSFRVTEQSMCVQLSNITTRMMLVIPSRIPTLPIYLGLVCTHAFSTCKHLIGSLSQI